MTIRITVLLAILCPSTMATAADRFPASAWERATPASVGMDASLLEEARNYALIGEGSGFITRHGKLVMSWGDVDRKYALKSTTKSFGATALGLAIGDGKMALSDRAAEHHPWFRLPPASNENAEWIKRITIRHLATHTAGFDKSGGATKSFFEPGTKWAYSDGGPNWLAECITLAYKQDINELMFDRVFSPIGIDRRDLSWRENAYREKQINGIVRREFGSGISANVDAMARLGYLYLRNGHWNGKQILPAEFISAAIAPLPDVVGLSEVDAKNYGNASDHYGLMWWNNADGTLRNVPRDAYWSWGLHESLIIVIPSLDIVVARTGSSWRQNWSGHYDVLQPFFDPIVAAVGSQTTGTSEDNSTINRAPRPRSPVIQDIRWTKPSTIVRKAKGGDNWPITWGDDDLLYTAYGDGFGFKPNVKQKLSLGLCTVAGDANNFRGINLRSSTAEQTGQGKDGLKASGLLMVNGMLYMLVRNAGNSQLAWSDDHGQTWTWSNWKFETSFGCPTFLNFGRNYNGARDEFVYVYSHDSDSAYKRSDDMVLARVPRDQVRDESAWEFFESPGDGEAEWTSSIRSRGSVFNSAGRCYRSSVSYNAPLRRYLWCQTGLGEDTRFAGGFAIYDAPEPWGPWTTAFETEKWDVGPGETSCLPTKWMSNNGRTIHLVFAGDDSFSVRTGTIVLRTADK